MAVVDNVLLKSKFRGCLLGVLLGDCFGAPFEGETITAGGKIVLQKYFDKLDGPYFKAPLKEYTDDTAMTISVAKCLIDKPTIDFKLMAKLFVQEYFNDRRRGYGGNVVEVFNKLRKNKFEDIYKPATEQFLGNGSFGNGGAMRVAPLGLYFHNNYKAAMNAVTNATKITHTNKLGINGAILQCLAIQQGLKIHPTTKIDGLQFTSELIDKMKEVEVKEEDLVEAHEDSVPYRTQLKTVQTLLKAEYNEQTENNVIEQLGNSIAALHSVPTAIFCFLKAQSEIPGITTDNIFRRTVQYAISLGGDTDTIASMAGAIAGAYLGAEYINESMLRHCEYQKEMLEMADNLFTVTENIVK